MLAGILPQVEEGRLETADELHELQVRITEGIVRGELSPKQVDALNSCVKGLWKKNDVKRQYLTLLLKYGDRAKLFEDAGLGEFLGIKSAAARKLLQLR